MLLTSTYTSSILVSISKCYSIIINLSPVNCCDSTVLFNAARIIIYSRFVVSCGERAGQVLVMSQCILQMSIVHISSVGSFL